jgi:hypothetical protein
MKKITYLFVLLFSLVLVITSCSKNDNPLSPDGTNGSGLRINKIADNNAMLNPFYNFGYDSSNHLIKIWEDGLYHSFIIQIEYNSNQKPIKLTHTDYYEGFVEDVQVTNIQWTNVGFNTLREDESNKDQSIYKIDQQGRISNFTYTYTNKSYNNPGTYTYSYSYDWSVNSKLTVNEIDPDDDTSTYNFQYNSTFNPLSQINIAIMVIENILSYDTDIYFQSKYCVSEIGHTNPIHNQLTQFFYTLNDQNYPIVIESRGFSRDYVYYEYESY